MSPIVYGSRTAIVTSQHGGARLDRALTEIFPEFSRSFLAKRIEHGSVRVDGVTVSKPSHRIEPGQRIEIDVPPPASTEVEAQDLPLTILFQDEDLVVVDKPAGLVVHPGAGHADQTLVNALLFTIRDLSGIGGELRPGIVHRLDKDTSGVMVIAKNDATHRALTSAWNTDRVRKQYLALVYGTPSELRGTVDAPIGRDPRDRKRMAVVSGGRRALTDYEVVERLRHASLVRCSLRTGRTHQIRVHMKHLGHPIIGDPVYSGPQWKGIPDKKIQKAIAGATRQMLHAERIAFPHPKTGEVVSFVAPVPEDFSALVDVLR